MNDYRFSIPQDIEFGAGSLKKLPDIINNEGIKSVFLVSDHNLEKIGAVKKVEDILDADGIKYDTFLDLVPNPPVETVNAAKAGYEACEADCIIALGGGGPMDVAKAVGVLVKYGGDIRDYEGNFKVPGPIAPIIAIPTTAGTGSEVTASAVITDTERNVKMSVISYNILPKYAVLDPELIMTAPASVAASCGVDALVHAMEAYMSTQASPFTDAMAEKAMELIGRSIRQFVSNRHDLKAASDMMAASNFAGLAFAFARLGYIHAMSHPVGAYFHVAHGVANAILMPAVVEFNALADHDNKYRKIYSYIHVGSVPDDFQPQMLVEELRKLNRDLGIPEHLADVGVTEDKIPAMAEDAVVVANFKVNPRQGTKQDIIDLYKKSM